MAPSEHSTASSATTGPSAAPMAVGAEVGQHGVGGVAGAVAGDQGRDLLGREAPLARPLAAPARPSSGRGVAAPPPAGALVGAAKEGLVRLDHAAQGLARRRGRPQEAVPPAEAGRQVHAAVGGRLRQAHAGRERLAVAQPARLLPQPRQRGAGQGVEGLPAGCAAVAAQPAGVAPALQPRRRRSAGSAAPRRTPARSAAPPRARPRPTPRPARALSAARRSSRSTRCSSTSKSASRIAHLAGIPLPAVCLPTTDAKRASRDRPGQPPPRGRPCPAGPPSRPRPRWPSRTRSVSASATSTPPATPTAVCMAPARDPAPAAEVAAAAPGQAVAARGGLAVGLLGHGARWRRRRLTASEEAREEPATTRPLGHPPLELLDARLQVRQRPLLRHHRLGHVVRGRGEPDDLAGDVGLGLRVPLPRLAVHLAQLAEQLVDHLTVTLVHGSSPPARLVRI